MDFHQNWRPVAHKPVTDEADTLMARKANLIQRKGRWYFNRAYPKDLWPITGKAPFRLTLGTDSLEEAQRQRGGAEQRYWAAVDAAREKMGGLRPRELTEIEAVAIASRWFRERNTELEASHLHQPTTPQGWSEAVSGNEFGIRDGARRLGMNDIQALAPLANRVLAAEGVAVEPGGKGYTTLLQTLARANKELAAIDLARLQGDFGYRPTDPLILAALEAKAGPRQRTIDDLIAAYEADNAEGWSPSTRNAYGPVWRLLRDALGSTREVATLNRDDGRRLFDIVKELPRGLGKIKVLAGLNVPQAVKRAKELGLETIGPKTITGSYMGFVSALFGWAVKEQWMAANPVVGLRVGDNVAARDKRDPFTTEQLQALFKAAPWSPRDESPKGQPLRFWGPLLALYQGMRRGEIAQLDLDDCEIVDGLPVLQVRPGGDGKRIKTDASRRMLPVHPELVRIGFMEFVSARRDTGAAKLFAGAKANTHGQWGDDLSDWFVRHLGKANLTGKRLGMHSFRHNFEDALRRAGLRGTDIGLALAGRSGGRRRDSGEDYGSGYTAKELADALSRISYPDLELAHLHRAD